MDTFYTPLKKLLWILLAFGWHGEAIMRNLSTIKALFHPKHKETETHGAILNNSLSHFDHGTLSHHYLIMTSTTNKNAT